MQKPPYLKKGDKVVILSTARKISEEEIARAVRVFEDWGLEVVFGDNLHQEDNQLMLSQYIRLRRSVKCSYFHTPIRIFLGLFHYYDRR